MSGIMGILSDKSKLLGEYFTGYENLVNEIITHGEDLNYIYDKLDEMLRNYSDLLKLASRNLFYEFENKAPLAALALFGHSGIYEYYKNVYESAKIKDKKEISKKKLIENVVVKYHPHKGRDSISKKLKGFDAVKVFEAKSEDNTWHNIEPSGKKYLVFYYECKESDLGKKFIISQSGNNTQTFEFDQECCVNYILDGIDVKCEKYCHGKLHYIEAR